ncbi:AT-rich interaction domain 6 [Gadus morhua]|uniref:AT-rich interaction domain 6 n=1 Tax=Gadus morhua TaxID=8049 RepID=UPI0011B691B7|nr:AT-rich interactive domain-containing protein 5A-like [Gadus morhua]
MKLQPSVEKDNLILIAHCSCAPCSQPCVMANGKVQEAMTVQEQKEPDEMSEEAFLQDLYLNMKKRDTPIERVPHLGFKQIDLYLMYKTVKDLGGYHQVTTHQLWKQVYNTLGGNPRSTSAATCTRRHYEKLLLPYECYLKGVQLRAVLPTQKRPPCDGLLEEGGVQRPLKRRLLPGTPLHQAPRSNANSHLRVISLPVHYPHYYHNSYPVLSTYVPMPPSLKGPPPGPPPLAPRAPTPPPPPPPPASPPPPAVPQPQAFYPPAPRQRPMEAAQKSLEHLRYLAQQYDPSTGLLEPLKEPLNLSGWAPRAEARESPASSFAPPSANKNPKFLNKPSPLYPASRERDQGSPPCVKQDPGDGQYLGSPPPYPDGAREDVVLNLKTIPGTCASGSPPASPAHPRRTPPGVRSPIGSPKADGGPSLAWDEGAESEQSLRRDVLEFGARLPFLKREHAESGKREIKIPLSVLHGWIKLISSSSAPASKLFPGEGDTATTTTTSPSPSPTNAALCMDSEVSPFDLRTLRNPPLGDSKLGSPRQKPQPNYGPPVLTGHSDPYPPGPGYHQQLALSSAFLKGVYGTGPSGWDPPLDFHRTPEAFSRDPHGQGHPFPLRLGGSWSPPAAREDFQGSSQRAAQASVDITRSPREEAVAWKGMTTNKPSSSSSPPFPQLTTEEIMKLKRIISCSP